MRYYLILFITALGVSGGAASGADAHVLQRVCDRVLARSVFTGPTPPVDLIPNSPYDPVLISVVASLKSRLPARRSQRWQTVSLLPVDASACRGPIQAHVKLSRRENADTFVIFPGSFATWKRGAYVNQTVYDLEAEFGDSNIVAFGGFLTNEFLRGACAEVPWNTLELAEDLYLRIQSQLGELFRHGRGGTVGFSGGGNLAAGLLFADAKHAPTQRLFDRGGLAFSPILHGRTAFRLLDDAFAKSPIPNQRTFLSLDPTNLKLLLRVGLPLNWKRISRLYNLNPEQFTARFYNQFHADLNDARNAVGLAGDSTFYNTFVREAVSQISAAPPDSRGSIYDQETDWLTWTAKIDRPFLVYFSQDDPVLSGAKPEGQPEELVRILEGLRKNPFIATFNPKFGGHTGALLEPEFRSILRTVLSVEVP